MNLKEWLVGMLQNNRTPTETEQAANIGEEDGRELTRAYVGGFRRGMAEVLTEEMTGFHNVIEVQPIAIESKPTTKRLPKQK